MACFAPTVDRHRIPWRFCGKAGGQGEDDAVADLAGPDPYIGLMREDSYLGLGAAGFHQIAFTDWGDPEGPAVACVHGLTRNGRDFDRLAAALADGGRRVICPDVVGRGSSDWLPRADLYGYPQYLADMAGLIARIDRPSLDWVGTSMGGILGMMLAAQPKSPIRRLVMNDVGPFVPAAAVERIAGYVGEDPSFADLAALEAGLRARYATVGALADEDWRHLATFGQRTKSDGSLGLAYDPAIGTALAAGPFEDVDLWALWDRVPCPVLLIQGMESDLLTHDIAEEMTRRGPRAQIVERPGVGHAPMLMSGEEIAAIRDFLDD